MELGLTVVTHTVGAWNRDLTRCIESVKKALPANGKHIIIQNDTNSFQQARYDAMKLDDIVVFVDDDDYISEDSLKLCQLALEKSDVGIAFTREVKITNDGRIIVSNPPILSEEIARGPEVIHHMVAYRTKHVSERSYQLSQRYNTGAEWIMTADAVSRAGAIHIPIDGYFWIQHPTQDHRIPERQRLFNEGKKHIIIELKEWLNTSYNIPVW